MRKLHTLLNPHDCVMPDYMAADVARIRARAPWKLAFVPDSKIRDAFILWSEDNYAAAWHSPTDSMIDKFLKWATSTPLQ